MLRLPSTVAVAPLLLPALACTVHEYVNSARLDNGIKHGDYERYQGYCSRRLRRIRTSKSVRLTNGNQHAYATRKIDAALVQQHPVALQVVLYCAERAWAASQALLAGVEDDGTGVQAAYPARQRQHAIRRLRVALKQAGQLRQLLEACGDARSIAEVRAYEAALLGSAMIRDGLWDDAVTQLEVARQVYGVLCDTARSSAGRALFSRQAEQLAAEARLAQFNLARTDGSDAVAVALAAAAAVVATVPGCSGAHGEEGADQAALATAAATSSATEAHTVAVVQWAGKQGRVTQATTLAGLKSAVETAAELNAGAYARSGDRETAFSSLVSTMDKAASALARAQARGGPEAPSATVTTGVRAQALEAQHARNMDLFSQVWASMAPDASAVTAASLAVGDASPRHLQSASMLLARAARTVDELRSLAQESAAPDAQVAALCAARAGALDAWATLLQAMDCATRTAADHRGPLLQLPGACAVALEPRLRGVLAACAAAQQAWTAVADVASLYKQLRSLDAADMLLDEARMRGMADLASLMHSAVQADSQTVYQGTALAPRIAQAAVDHAVASALHASGARAPATRADVLEFSPRGKALPGTRSAWAPSAALATPLPASGVPRPALLVPKPVHYDVAFEYATDTSGLLGSLRSKHDSGAAAAAAAAAARPPAGPGAAARAPAPAPAAAAVAPGPDAQQQPQDQSGVSGWVNWLTGR